MGYVVQKPLSSWRKIGSGRASRIQFFLALFCGEACNPRELAELKRLATPVRFMGGQTIFSEGDLARNAFGLSYGVVRLYRLLPDGRRQVVAFALPGDFLAMPLADRFSFAADAVGEVGVCKFPREQLKLLIQNSPNIMRLLVEFAARELKSAQDQLTLLGSGSAAQRRREWQRFLSTGASAQRDLRRCLKLCRCRCAARTSPIFSASSWRRSAAHSPS